MNTMVIPENTHEAGWGERPKSVGNCASFQLVEAFGDRIYSVAKHITQNDDHAADVLIETFLEICSDRDGYQDDEKAWLELVTVAVRRAFSKLRNQREDRLVLDRVADSSEDLLVRELLVWGDSYQQRHSGEPTTRVLEHGLRSLDPMCRTVFMLRDIEEMSVRQIANIVDRSVPAVEVCLLRARFQLQQILRWRTRQQQ